MVIYGNHRMLNYSKDSTIFSFLKYILSNNCVLGSTVGTGHSRGKLAKKLPWRSATYILVNVGPGKLLLRATHCSK